MMRNLCFLALPMILFSLAGCAGGDAEDDSDTGGAAGGPAAGDGGGASDLHAEPPSPGPARAPDGAGHVTFAISTLLLGDRDRSGRLDAGAWEQYGFDLDHLDSGARAPDGFTGLCLPQDGASRASVQTDGEAGIDNAFGRTLLPLALAADPQLPDDVAASLAGGGATLLIDLDRLGAGADYTGLTARLYTGAPLGERPAYGGGDVWPIRADSLTDPGDPASARLSAADSYVVGDTWVGRFHGTLTVELPWIEQLTLHLRVHDPVITMDLDAARTGAQNGTLAGVIATEDLLAEAEAEALRLDPTLCPDTSTVKQVLAELAAASDILADGSEDPTLPCDGISIGIGFDAKRVALGPVVAQAPAAPLPACEAGGN
jgi:hypothetical protein